MKIKTTLLAALSCLLFASSCQKSDDKKKDIYATNKAGERLVEKIDINNVATIYLAYNSDNTIKTITGVEGTDIRTLSFEKKNNILYMSLKEQYGDLYTAETSYDLNNNGFIILDRGWEGEDNYRLSYDPSGKYLHNVFKDDELLWTFEWKDGNIYNEEVTYIDQAHPSNIDWCAYFQTWRVNKNDENEILVNLPSLTEFWGFSDGYFGSKCKGLPAEDMGCNYTYDFTEDGYIASIYITSKKTGETTSKLQITYLKK